MRVQLLLIWLMMLSQVIAIEHNSNLRVHTRTSYKDEAKGIIGWIILEFIVGPCMFISSFFLIWFNQKKAAIDHRRIKIVEEISLDINPYYPGNIKDNHNKMVHMLGDTISPEIIVDPLCGVFCNNSIKLMRYVEVREWRAKEKLCSRQLQYFLEWSTQHQQEVVNKTNDSSNWFIQNQQFLAKKVILGQYFISDQQKRKCKKSVPIYPNNKNVQKIMQNCHPTSQPQIIEQYIYFPSKSDNSIDGQGALRISFFQCLVGPITIMAKANNNSLQAFNIAVYQNHQQDKQSPLACACQYFSFTQASFTPLSLIEFVHQEKLSTQQVINKQLSQTTYNRNINRVKAYLIMAGGLALFFAPLPYIIGFVPFIGGYLSGSLFFILLLASLAVCVPLFLLMVSISWLFFHPKVGLILFTIAIVLLVVLLVLTKGGHANPQAPKHLMDIGYLALRNTG